MCCALLCLIFNTPVNSRSTADGTGGAEDVLRRKKRGISRLSLSLTALQHYSTLRREKERMRDMEGEGRGQPPVGVA
jgi:hypothetical protein